MKNLLSCTSLLEYLKRGSDPWAGTPLEGYYYKSSKQKGVYGELLVAAAARSLGYTVEPRTGSGHDAVINGVKTEVKFSVKSGPGYVFNHLALGKDWDRAIFACIDSRLEPEIVWCTKADVADFIRLGKYFVRQQGGKGGGNDDWMFNTQKNGWVQFTAEPAVVHLSKW